MFEAAAPAFLTRTFALLPCAEDELIEVVRELPPLAVVARACSVVDRLARDPRAGRDREVGEELARELDALAALIAATWSAGGDWVAVLLWRDDAEARAALRAGPSPEPVRGSDRDAWEPMAEKALAVLVGRAAGHTPRDAAVVYPPLALWSSCLALAAALRATEPEPRLTLRPRSPHAVLAEQGAHRALVLAAAADLRADVERGFPGVAARMEAKGTRRDAPVAGPYRAHVATEEPLIDEPPVVAGAVSFEPVERARLPELFEEACAHALRGALRAAERAAIEDALRAAGHPPPDGHERAAEVLAELASVRARVVLRVIELGVFPIALHEAVVELHAAVSGLAIEVKWAGHVIVQNLARAGRALTAVTSLLGLQLGLSGDASTLAAAVAGHMAMVAPRAPENRFEELVHAVTVVLRGTTFADLYAGLAGLAHDVADAERSFAAVDARIPWYERAGLFGNGAATFAREAKQRDAVEGRRKLETTTGAVRGYLEGALRSVHPQAHVYYRAFHVQAALGGVHVVGVPTSRRADDRPRLVGDDEARRHLETWTGELLGAFGHVPSPGELVEQHAAALLERARSGRIERADGRRRV